MKVSALTNDQIDFLIAKIEGITHPKAMRNMEPGFVMAPVVTRDIDGVTTTYCRYSPTTDWGVYGEIILREGISVAKFFGPIDGPIELGSEWAAISIDDTVSAYGNDPRVAAMRVHIMKHYGGDIPVEAFV